MSFDAFFSFIVVGTVMLSWTLFPAWQNLCSVCYPSSLTERTPGLTLYISMYVLIRVALQQKHVCMCAHMPTGMWNIPWSTFLVQVPQDLFTTVPKQSRGQDITCICFSPSEETMVVNTNKSQLYIFTMPSTDLLKVSATFPHSTTSMPSKGYIVMAQAIQCHFLWCVLMQSVGVWTLKPHEVLCTLL